MRVTKKETLWPTRRFELRTSATRIMSNHTTRPCGRANEKGSNLKIFIVQIAYLLGRAKSPVPSVVSDGSVVS